MSIGSAYCSQCGAALSVDDRACPACGTEVDPTATTQTSYVEDPDFGPVDDSVEIGYPTGRGRDFDAGQAVRWLRERFGPLGDRRPSPSVSKWIAAAGGTILGLGATSVVGSIIDEPGDSTTAALVMAVCLAGAVAALAMLPRSLLPAMVAATNTFAVALGLFIAFGSGDNNGVIGALVAAVVLIGLYLAGPSRGHASHLALFLVALVLGGLVLGAREALESLDFGAFSTNTIVVLLVLGTLYLGAGEWLDRYGMKGMATPFLAVGVVALIAGVAVFVNRSNAWGGAVGIVVAAVVLYIASDRRRRGLLWLGAIGLVGAVFAVVLEFSTDSNDVAIGLVLVVAGALIAAASPRAAEAMESWRREDVVVE